MGKWAQGPGKSVPRVILTSALCPNRPQCFPSHPTWRQEVALAIYQPQGPLRSVFRTRLWSSCPTCTSSDPSVLKELALSLVLPWPTFPSANYVLGPPGPPDPTSCQTQLRASGQWEPGCRSLSWRQSPMPCTGSVPGNGSGTRARPMPWAQTEVTQLLTPQGITPPPNTHVSTRHKHA